jgi:pyridoxamine 5'-phosphate oxidase
MQAFDERGFIFSSSKDSTKGQHLAENPYAAVVMFWPELMLQIRAEGRVEPGDEQDMEMCFGQLPRNVRCLSLAFKQGTIIQDRQTYVDRIKKVCL